MKFEDFVNQYYSDIKLNRVLMENFDPNKDYHLFVPRLVGRNIVSVESIKDTIGKYQEKMKESTDKYIENLEKDIDTVAGQTKYGKDRAENVKKSILSSRVNINNPQKNKIEIESAKVYNYLILEKRDFSNAEYTKNLKYTIGFYTKFLPEILKSIESNLGLVEKGLRTKNPEFISKFFGAIVPHFSNRTRSIVDQKHFTDRVLGNGRFELLVGSNKNNGLSGFKFVNADTEVQDKLTVSALSKQESVIVADLLMGFSNTVSHQIKKAKNITTKSKPILKKLLEYEVQTDEEAILIKRLINVLNTCFNIISNLIKYYDALNYSAYRFINESFKLYGKERTEKVEIKGPSKLKDMFKD